MKDKTKKRIEKHTKHLASEDLKLTKALFSGMREIGIELLKTQKKVEQLEDYIKLNFSRNTNYIG